MKKTLTESKLKNIVNESVKKVLKEYSGEEFQSLFYRKWHKFEDDIYHYQFGRTLRIKYNPGKMNVTFELFTYLEKPIGKVTSASVNDIAAAGDEAKWVVSFFGHYNGVEGKEEQGSKNYCLNKLIKTAANVYNNYVEEKDIEKIKDTCKKFAELVQAYKDLNDKQETYDEIEF